MAKQATETVDNGEGTKKRRASGPRKSKPTHVLFRVTDPNGQPVPGAKLEIVLATKDTDAFMDAFEANPDATRARLQV